MGSEPQEPKGTGGTFTEDPIETEEEEDLGQISQGEPGGVGSQPDFTKSKKVDYPAVGPNGPGDLNIEGDSEGPIELFEFGESDDGWVNCTAGYYWHQALGGGIYLHEDEWY